MAKRTKAETAASTVAGVLDIGVGYVWGRYGWLDALVAFGLIIAGLFAVLGLLSFVNDKLAEKPA